MAVIYKNPSIYAGYSIKPFAGIDPWKGDLADMYR